MPKTAAVKTISQTVVFSPMWPRENSTVAARRQKTALLRKGSEQCANHGAAKHKRPRLADAIHDRDQDISQHFHAQILCGMDGRYSPL